MTQHQIMIIDPERALTDSRQRKDIVKSMIDQSILRPGYDFGVIPGSNKPSLLKPGAERLCSAFGFDPRFETLTSIERWDGDEPLFFYRIVCRLIHIETGLEVATGIGSCNSFESKYRWRWANEDEVPPHLDKSKLVTRNSTVSEFQFSVERAETTGKYAKPAEYWQRFQDAIANGTARAGMRQTKNGNSPTWEIGGLQYRIPNDDIFSLVNTIDKMAQKRALIAAALIGANASEFFTQDIEDMVGFGVDIAGETLPTVTITEVEPGQGEKSPIVTTPKKAETGKSQQWSSDEATAFAQRMLDEKGFTTADLFEALNIKTRWSEWKGTAAEAETAIEDWHKRRMDTDHGNTATYDKQAVYEAVAELYNAYPHFTRSLAGLAADGKIVASMTTEEVVNAIRAHKAQV